MDNLPKDPPDDNGNNPTPPPFGTHFNSNPLENLHHSQTLVSEPLNPPNSPNIPNHPNNNHDDPDEIKHEHYSEAAQSKPRDEHGRFIPDPVPTPTTPTSQTPPTSLNSSLPSNPSTPPPITITENTKYSEKKDPPLFNVSVIFTNPVTYLKNFLSKFLKNQDIDLRLKIKPFATIGLVIAFGMVGGTAFSVGRYFFPNSSPILHRQVVYSGEVKAGGGQGNYYLMSSDSKPWKLKSKNNNIDIPSLFGKQVIVTGNLTAEPNLIEVSEVIVSETNTQSITPTAIPSPQTSLLNTQTIQNQDLIPKLYSGVTWETNQKKILTFTSGKRRIEQEGVYLESTQVPNLPQEFINYYTNQLTNLGFKETLNSKDPDGTMITYSKDELFLTFGIKNIYSGSGDNKKVTSYRAYIEHN